jgi:RsmE family RNA methyltransferase
MTVTLDCDPPKKLPLTLVLALPRPKVLNRLFVAISSMGVGRLILLNCWRVEKTYWSTPRLAEMNIRHQLILGLEQARDTGMPQVEIRRRFVPFVEDELTSLVGDSTALVAHPLAERECPRAMTSAVTLAIGPEGGFIENEIHMLKDRGFIPVHLGSRPLRVEHAVPALLGRLF